MQQSTRVLLLLHEHHLQSSVATDGRRLLDVLNDRMTEYVKLSDCAATRAAEAGQPAGSWTRGVVFKTGLSVAAPVETEHEAPQKRHNMMVQKARWEVFLTVPRYEVRGFVQLERPIAPHEYQVQLNRDGTTFFAVTDAVLTPSTGPGEPLRLPVALINRYRIGFFTLAEQPAPQ